MLCSGHPSFLRTGVQKGGKVPPVPHRTRELTRTRRYLYTELIFPTPALANNCPLPSLIALPPLLCTLTTHTMARWISLMSVGVLAALAAVGTSVDAGTLPARSA